MIYVRALTRFAHKLIHGNPSWRKNSREQEFLNRHVSIKQSHLVYLNHIQFCDLRHHTNDKKSITTTTKTLIAIIVVGGDRLQSIFESQASVNQ